MNGGVCLFAGGSRTCTACSEDSVESGVSFRSRREVVIGQQRVRMFEVQPGKCCKLILQQFENELCVKLSMIDVSCLKPAVMIVLDQVVVGVAREGQGVDPQRIYR